MIYMSLSAATQLLTPIREDLSRPRRDRHRCKRRLCRR